jgi:CBS domain-containing protein
MKHVAQILKTKSDQTVYTIAPTASAFDAAELMALRNIGALLVLEGTQVVGIVTERDYARKMALSARSARVTPVRDIMVSPVSCVNPDHTNECMALMTDKRLRHLPVIETASWSDWSRSAIW